MSSFSACFGASALSTPFGSPYRVMTVSEAILNPPLADQEILACFGRGDRLQTFRVLIVPDRRIH